MAVDLDAVGAQVDQPDLDDPGAGAQGHLDPPVPPDRAVGHHHQQEDVLGTGVGGPVEVRTRPQHGEVRLRLGPVVQDHWVLD